MTTEVRRNDDQSRYEITVDGELAGVADFRDAGDVIVFPHTEIARHLRGRGLASELVQFALDDVRGRGRTVVPGCWYVAQFIDDHPHYADLVAS